MGGLIEETLSAAKLVISFANEDKEIEKFINKAMAVQKSSQKAEVSIAIFTALIRFMIFGFYVYSFWIGTEFIRDKRNNVDGEPYTAGTILITLLALITGMLLIMQLTPNL